MQTVQRDLGFQYDVDPWVGRAVSTNPVSQFDRGVILRQAAPARQLPWTPVSYPSVGREPGNFPLNPSQG